MKEHNNITDLKDVKLNENTEKLRFKIVKLCKCNIAFFSALALIMSMVNFVLPFSEIIEAVNIVFSSIFFNVIFCIDLLLLFYYLIPFIIYNIKLFKLK